MVKIIAPRSDYTGISASVQFVNGIGETDNKRLIDWFKKNGYDIKPTEEVNSDSTEDSDSKAESTSAETKTKKSNPNREK